LAHYKISGTYLTFLLFKLGELGILENFWSQLKSRTYVSIEPFHLFRHLDKQGFRFNNRKATHAARFNMALSGVVGNRRHLQRTHGQTTVRASLPGAFTGKKGTGRG